MNQLRKMEPEEEVQYLRRLYGEQSELKIMELMKDSFNTLQNRSQMLLSLSTICLTITGFSGPRIAQASGFSRFFIGFGLFFVLCSVLVLVCGPLSIRWLTRYQGPDFDQTVERVIYRRNWRTKRYHLSALLLVIGLGGYVMSVLGYLWFG